MAHLGIRFILSTIVVCSLFACGSEDEGPEPPHGEVSTAPLCADVFGAGPRELFSTAVVDPSAVADSLIFGDMDPGSQAPFNYELGFRLNDINVEVFAPADLHVRTVQYQTYLRGPRAGETDYAMSFDLCADEDQHAVVEGDLAHLTSLEPQFLAILTDAELECRSKTGPEEDTEECTAYFWDEGIVIEAGTLIGTGGGTGVTDYRPGLDFNLLDSRYANAYVNPDRIGSEEGPGRAFRYGACVYEYFTPTLRDAYLARIGQNGVPRDSEEAPCGTMSIGVEGSAAGIWIRAEAAHLDINEDLFGVIDNLLVLAPDLLDPGSKQALSTELSEFNSVDGEPRLMVYPFEASGDVNIAFSNMEPETTYCVAATPLGEESQTYYYLRLGAGGETLQVERLGDDCTAIPQGERTITGAAIDFVR